MICSSNWFTVTYVEYLLTNSKVKFLHCQCKIIFHKKLWSEISKIKAGNIFFLKKQKNLVELSNIISWKLKGFFSDKNYSWNFKGKMSDSFLKKWWDMILNSETFHGCPGLLSIYLQSELNRNFRIFIPNKVYLPTNWSNFFNSLWCFYRCST